MGRLNRQKALDLLGQDLSLYHRIVGYFIKDYGDYPRRIGEYIARREKQAYIVTHSLKNIAASLGAEDLSHLALELETVLKREDFPLAGEPLGRLLEEFPSVLEEVQLLAGERENCPAVQLPEGEGDFAGLLSYLAEEMGSFSPDRAEEALERLARSENLIPGECGAAMEQVRDLAREFRYLEAEEILLDLRERIPE